MNPIQRSLRRQIGVKSTFSYSFKNFSLFSTSLAVQKFIYPDGENALSRHRTSMSPPPSPPSPRRQRGHAICRLLPAALPPLPSLPPSLKGSPVPRNSDPSVPSASKQNRST